MARPQFVLPQLRAGVPEGLEGARRVAQETGRMKYLRPIFLELAEAQPDAARRVFAEAKAGYHPIARSIIEGVLRA